MIHGGIDSSPAFPIIKLFVSSEEDIIEIQIGVSSTDIKVKKAIGVVNPTVHNSQGNFGQQSPDQYERGHSERDSIKYPNRPTHSIIKLTRLHESLPSMVFLDPWKHTQRSRL
jgi:hypothetical protein